MATPDTSIYGRFQLPQIADPLEQQQRFMTLKGALEQQQAAEVERQRQAAYRQEVAGLGPNASEDDLQRVGSRYATPDKLLATLTASRDRQAQTAATAEAKRASLAQAGQQLEFMREFRMSQARTAEEKAKVDADFRQQMLELRKQMQNATGARNQAPAGYRATPDGNLEPIPGGPADAKNNKPPKPPKDYEWTDDTYTEVRPIKGGPKDTSDKDAARLEGAKVKANTVIKKVDEALANTGFFTTGLTGSVLGKIPGTPAYDLDRTIDTIKAQVGFAELQAMRDASPTGGALGQVAVQELTMLQSTLASLEKGQSEDQLRRGLEQVREHFQNWKAAVEKAEQGNNTPKPGVPTPAPAPGQKYPRATGPGGRAVIFKDGRWQPER